MPAVTLDASVVDGSNTLPFPNPILGIQLPINIAPETSSALATPINVNPISLASIGGPVLVSSEAVGDIVAPVLVSSESVSDIATPSIIAANALNPETPPFALNHARILYDNILVNASVAANQGINPNYTLIPNTAQRWTATLAGITAAIEYTFPTNSNIDTICLGSHNISSVGGTFEILYHPDPTGVFIQISPDITPVNNNSIMIHLGAAVSARRLQIKIKNATGSFYLGSVYAGIALQMQRPFFSGHTPAVLARQADYFSSMSESGNFIGVNVRRRALESSAAWANLSDAWYREYFVPFLSSAETLPFYFAWNLLQYPTDVAYCKNITNIAPSYSGKRDLMAVDIPLIGIA